ncbi:MAG: putative hydro-lyase [Rhodospirillales bacterium]|nr:putative hydro-lyase [Rhodospirillales bacterium]
MPPREIRKRIRAQQIDAPTTGMADGYVQANLVILPEADAADFLAYCRANPKPCPLLGVGRPGDVSLDAVAKDLDIRTDLPGYRIFRDGVSTDRVSDITPYWRDDLVTFALGCSFSFEHALLDAGLPVRHIELGRNVPMFRTTIPTVPRGSFTGPLVVTMRPYRPADAIAAILLSERYPLAHGAPVHMAFPEAIGISDLGNPDYGDPVPVEPGEIPVFWACGVTPQAALEQAALPFAITHDPGHMLITDIANTRIVGVDQLEV